MGIVTFQIKHKIDLYALAEEFCERTTDKALRDKLLKGQAEDGSGSG